MQPYQKKQFRFGSTVGPKITTVPTSIGAYKPIQPKKPKRNPNLRKENSYSIFFLTVNTNLNFGSRRTEAERDLAADKLREALDNMFGNDPGAGGNCDFLEFFKLVPGNYPVYQDDNGGGNDYEKWCGYFKEVWIKAATEWSSKKENRRLLHAHAIIKVLHSTRIHLDRDAIARYIANEMGLNYMPYVHIDLVNPSLYYILEYIQKDVQGDAEDPVDSITQDTITDDILSQITEGMINLNVNKKYY